VRRPKVTLLLCAMTIGVSATADAAESSLIGGRIPDFTLKNQFGKEYSLADLKAADVVVVAFLGAECPLAKLYGPRLAELATKFKKDKVAFLAIDSNRQDSIEEVAAYAQRNHLDFPMLKDTGNKVADQFGAERTPEVFVLDKDRVVCYHGRVDDQYGFTDGVGYQRPHAARGDLDKAIGELVAGKKVSVPVTSVVGCKIGRVRQPVADAKVTYSNQIARILQNRCVECHREGQIGPFAMTSYDEVTGWGEMIREVVHQGRMPPWHANKSYGKFANDTSLTDEEKKLILSWVDNGCPQGDPSDLPPPRKFTDGWVIPEPDQIVYFGDKPIDVPAEGVIDYYYSVVDPGWKEDKWIRATEAKPGSPETVHHILVFVQPPGSRLFVVVGGGRLLAGYGPGASPVLNTDGTTATLVKAGSKLIFQMHYTPNGKPAKDRSYVGIKFADPNKVKYAIRSASVASIFFAIPPGDSDYQVSSEGTFPNDTIICNLTPHMHMRGKSFRYEVTYPDGKKEILLDVPRYDFNWQTTYELEKPKLLPKGTKLVCTAHWDNSENNLSNPDPTKTVTWGDQTFDEMMIGFYTEMFPKGKIPERPSGGLGLAQLAADKLLATFDANKDSKITKKEMPVQFGQRFEMIDRNHDGEVDKKELDALLRLMRILVRTFGGGEG
jgi:peroxiredoxin